MPRNGILYRMLCNAILNTIEWFTANVGTEGAVKIFLFWDVFKELLVTQPVLPRFG
jgi:hypothetical protein